MEFEESLISTDHELRRTSLSLPFQTVDGKVHFVYKRVAVVEQFFDIIYSVHVESAGDTQLRGRAGKHCGQKRTYRAVSSLTKLNTRMACSRQKNAIFPPHIYGTWVHLLGHPCICYVVDEEEFGEECPPVS